MRTATFVYPEALPALANMSPAAFENEARLAMAAKLYELGRITSGQAAALAGIGRTDFLLSCSRFGVPSVIWEEQEIKRELDGL